MAKASKISLQRILPQLPPIEGRTAEERQICAKLRKAEYLRHYSALWRARNPDYGHDWWERNRLTYVKTNRRTPRARKSLTVKT